MNWTILEIRRLGLAQGEINAFMRVFFDENRIVGHFEEGEVHASFGFKVSPLEIEGLCDVVRTLHGCQHKDSTEHLLAFCIVESDGSNTERTRYCIIPEEGRKEQHAKLAGWVSQMFDKGQQNRDP